MELTKKIHLLHIDFEITISPDVKIPRFVNSIIIFGKNITLIDTGVKGSEEKIFEYIEQNGRKKSELKTIILSHAHPDHIGSAAKIKKITDCRVFAHKDEVEWIENINLQNEQRPVPGFFNLVDQSVTVDKKLYNGQVLKVDDDITLDIIHAPGHSKGSINIFFKEDQILFTADSIPLKNDIPNYDDFKDLMRSLKRMLNNSNYKTLLTSWTPPIYNLDAIEKLIQDGKNYMRRIDTIVKSEYENIPEAEPLSCCKKTIEKLGLPPVLVNPIVDKAFRSHLG